MSQLPTQPMKCTFSPHWRLDSTETSPQDHSSTAKNSSTKSKVVCLCIYFYSRNDILVMNSDNYLKYTGNSLILIFKDVSCLIGGGDSQLEGHASFSCICY